MFETMTLTNRLVKGIIYINVNLHFLFKVLMRDTQTLEVQTSQMFLAACNGLRIPFEK